jgi:hypothetical protein
MVISIFFIKKIPLKFNLKIHYIHQSKHQAFPSITLILKIPKSNFCPIVRFQEKKDAVVDWAWPQEMRDNMFAVVNTYTRASQFKGLSAENSYQLQRVGGEVLGMIN